ncbi:HAD hydrolase-like protein [Micromonospora sp. CPCC 206061]|uniref:HAD hydrolase-like protein n=1 Tax=Micromonospora sp. CPCC 206061 TaxID=3122410 RepID=UPI002FF31E2C
MNDNGRPELVIFDCDGVLVQSEPIVISVLAKRLRLLGVEISDEECFRKFVGLSQDAAEHLILRLVGRNLSRSMRQDLFSSSVVRPSAVLAD